jgi:formate dehydrogenase major subunit
MAANPKSISLPETVRFTLNGEALEALAQETILQAAKRVGIEIPYLCYKDDYRPDGNCRACMVEIKGERALAPACCRKPSEGMEVWSDNERARHSQTMILELLLSDIPGQGKSPYTPRSELDHWAERLGVGKPRFPGRKQPPKRSVPSRHRRQSGRVHPVHAVCARLPRRAGQRRHRLCLPRRPCRDSL